MRSSDWSSDVCSSDLLQGKMKQHVFPHLSAADHRDRERADIDEGGIDDGRRFFTRWLGLGEEQPCRRTTAAQQDALGRASCRERLCQYVSISVGAVSLKKKKKCRT